MPVTGSKCQVYSGSAKHTSGNLCKSDLTKNSQGRIVSRRQSANAAQKFGKSVLQGRFLSAKHVARDEDLPVQDVMMAKPGSQLYKQVHDRTIQWCAKNDVPWVTQGIPAYHKTMQNGVPVAVANPEWIQHKKNEAALRQKFGSTQNKNKNKSTHGSSQKSRKSLKHSFGKSGKSGKSAKSGKPGKSSKSSKSSKSFGRSGKKSGKSKSIFGQRPGKSKKSGKFGKSNKSGKSKSGRNRKF